MDIVKKFRNKPHSLIFQNILFILLWPVIILVPLGFMWIEMIRDPQIGSIEGLAAVGLFIGTIYGAYSLFIYGLCVLLYEIYIAVRKANRRRWIYIAFGPLSLLLMYFQLVILRMDMPQWFMRLADVLL